ncbi:MAG TPA: 2-phosphosulfolactate phosphatase, partial [Ktedonobacteraceae bacterium]
ETSETNDTNDTSDTFETSKEIGKTSLQLNVFFTPAEIVVSQTQQHDIYIVIDVIRATTTLTVMFDQGAVRVLVAGSIEEAREAVQKVPGRLLCGERNVKPLPGFDYGNSPAQFSQLDLTGRELILTTTNGTRAFYACPEHATCLAGSFYNAHAVTSYAFKLARERNCNISLVCSGELGYFALDDAVCAGYLALELRRCNEEFPQEAPLHIDESANAAIALYHAYEPPKVLDYCNSAQSVFQAGLIDDPYFCMRLSNSTNIPMVVGREEQTGLLVLEKTSTS